MTLILGCFLILMLEVPVVYSAMIEDLDGPYPAWEADGASGEEVGTTPALAAGSPAAEAEEALVEEAGVRTHPPALAVAGGPE
jgi:hypothetical protein